MAQSIAKGVVALTVDELELEASLAFTPDPDGAEWTGEKILRLAMDARISSLNQKRAEELVAKFARSRTPLSETIAKGQAPEAPRPEEAEWEELPFPEEWRSLIEESLASAPPPELYAVRSEVVRVEKTVQKPAKLPFLRPKAEKVLVSEKRERRERVHPDPSVLKTGYARKGERLALLSAAKAGKAGKSIFGRPLPAEQGEELAFLLGDGVERRKNELLAARDGVLRAGARWAELLPFAAPSYEVRKAPGGATFLLDYEPGDSRLPSPSPAEILAKARELGAPEGSLLPEAELAGLLAAAAAERKPLKARPLSLDRDGSAQVAISPDGLRATLTLRKGRGKGKPLELSAVSAALKNAVPGGLKGVKAEELKKDVLEFYKSDRDELLDYLLVEGKAPVRGKDRSLVLALEFLPEEEAAALRARLQGHPGLAMAAPDLAEFPLDEAARLAFVQEGQKIGSLSPGSPGQPGLDLFGRPIPGLPGNDPGIRTCDGALFAKGVVSAARAGLLAASEKDGLWRFRVLPCRDASMEVSVSPDAMAAFLTLRPEEGLGEPLTVEGVLAALAEKGVTSGQDAKAIGAAVVAARSGEAVLRRPVARGRPALPAGGLRLLWLARRPGEPPAPAAPAPGASGPAAQGAAAAAAPSAAALAALTAAEPPKGLRVAAGEAFLKAERRGAQGEPGLDVLGRAVPAPPPAAASGGPSTEAGARAAAAAGAAVPLHDATVREEALPDGSTLLVAAVSGELLVESGRVAVRDRLALDSDVGPLTGNVVFPGPVRVQGSVLAGFSLTAGGDALVGGSVEAALVSSDGRIALSGGVKGARRGTLRARKTIEASFAEQSLLLAVEDIRIKSSVVLCNAKTNGRFLVSDPKGAIVGGLTRARKGVEAAQIGSERGVKTEISFGQDYLVADQIEAEAREIERLKALVVRADRTMAELERAAGLSGAGAAGLDPLRQDKVKLMKLIEKRSIRLFDLREKFEEHHPSEVRVRGTIYPGVILESHNRFFEVRSKRTGVAFSFDPGTGRIVERPL